MSDFTSYTVMTIPKHQTHEWLLKTHYAKRIPMIELAFGLYRDDALVGVCTFGPPPRSMNNGKAIFDEYEVKTYELNRLVIQRGQPKNVLSYFVSKCVKQISTPACLVSYADHTFGHVGYIYQATNWIYTGLNQIHEREWIFNGKEIHQRTLSELGLTSAAKKIAYGLECKEYGKKHRYLMFLGTKSQRKEMAKRLRYKIHQYPKGDNVEYDANYQPTTQGLLFR